MHKIHAVGRMSYLLVLLALLWSFRPAVALTIDFESLTDSESITGQFPGASFANAIVLRAGISLNEFEFPPASGQNVASDSGGAMSIVFTSPVLLTCTDALRVRFLDDQRCGVGAEYKTSTCREELPSSPR